MTNEEKIIGLLTNMQGDIDSIKETQAVHTEILREQSATLSEHSAILSEHSAILSEHSAILLEHSAILSEHSAILSEHGEILSEHTTLLNALIEWADECREADKLPLPKLM